MKRVSVIVPVAPFEPFSVVEKSVESLKNLNTANMDVQFIYVIDRPDNAKVNALLGHSVTVIPRNDTRGRRAGAINDSIRCLKGADYIALFDVDSRPHPLFLMKCISALEKNNQVAIASGPRYVTNEQESIITKVISTEYFFFSQVYESLERFDGFKQFNGLIGVLDARIFENDFFDEQAPCEDWDLNQRIYLKGKTAIYVRDASVGEQAPLNMRQLYNQRVRWMAGAWDGLHKYLHKFSRAQIPASRKISWFIEAALPFASAALTPLALLYGIVFFSRRPAIILGLVIHVWLVSLCGASAAASHLLSKKIEWKAASRTED